MMNTSEQLQQELESMMDRWRELQAELETAQADLDAERETVRSNPGSPTTLLIQKQSAYDAITSSLDLLDKRITSKCAELADARSTASGM
jgi:chromosome segregation ATPase